MLTRPKVNESHCQACANYGTFLYSSQLIDNAAKHMAVSAQAGRQVSLFWMSQPHLPRALWTPEIDFVTCLQDAVSAYMDSLLGYVVFITCTGVHCWDYMNKCLCNVVSPCPVPIVHWCAETRKHKRRGKQKSKFIVVGQFLGKPSSGYGALRERFWACEGQ